ncbi:carboxymuconolactone decarboxylase family protein [Granulosicoccus antarcticus]|uniref:carboxymuconolactone decarboxylase family protein n=1 Tax=Granulosicoccus antarcticus TaxID=437505 RepID=UPI0012FD65B4|nr:carboxymuconolactone decarboxylase family protein [Granulosicoccus antarcticus]
MSRLSTPEEASLQQETLEALESVRMNGKLAEVYLQFANSEHALRAYLHMEQALAGGSLSKTETEAIKLWVSQQTGCDYCLSVHTFKSKQAGLNAEQQRALRKGEPTGDSRIDCMLKVAQALMQVRGKLPEALLAEARETGLSDENLVDLTMAISTIYFTNLTNHINDSISSLPPAPDLS